MLSGKEARRLLLRGLLRGEVRRRGNCKILKEAGGGKLSIEGAGAGMEIDTEKEREDMMRIG